MTTIRQQLTQLETFGLLRLAQPPPELEYLFRHPLIQDAAYSTVLRGDRKRIHLAAGEALEGSTRSGWTTWRPCWPSISWKPATIARCPISGAPGTTL